jgi:phospholipid/cholesterol/gamma-HCH transport system permease protein
MPTPHAEPAAISQPSPPDLELSGAWTASGIASLQPTLQGMHAGPAREAVANCTGICALDTAGAWVLETFLQRLRVEGCSVTPQGLKPGSARLLDAVSKRADDARANPPIAAAAPPTLLAGVGKGAIAARDSATAFLSFVGESALAFANQLRQPRRIRWRPILFNIRTAGFDALPIVGLLSFLLGIVVAYQGADQLRRYGASIFVADLVGVSMLREFAPLITAIIVAGRSGSAYAAQIGTMAVTEEIDAMRTIGIAPLELLVLPKVIALVIALPLLTVFADVLGVLGGMLMAQAQLGVGHADFIDRISKAVSITTLMVGIGKAPAFAAIIALVGCFEGFRTRGGAESVGRQTTRSVVEAIFLVIVADAIFSVAFSKLEL